MKGRSYITMKKLDDYGDIVLDDEGNEVKVEKMHKIIFDHREILSVTIIEKPNSEEPDYFHIVTKQGVPLDIEYDEDTYIELANYFRKEGVL